jgi:hypothetical protein
MQIDSQCMYCRWFKRDGSGACDAFDEIPEQILFNLADHREEYPNDRGVRWELALDAPPGSTHPSQQ